MDGFVDVRDAEGLLLCRYCPLTGEVEVVVHRYDRGTRKHLKEKRTAALPRVLVITTTTETRIVDSVLLSVV